MAWDSEGVDAPRHDPDEMREVMVRKLREGGIRSEEVASAL